jgi:hypothetical protein
MTAEELKALLSTPFALAAIMIFGSLVSAWKQMIVAKRGGNQVSVSDYFLQHWPETVAMLGANIMAFIGLVFADSLTPVAAVGIGYMANDFADMVTKEGRSAATGSDRQGGFARWSVLAVVAATCVAIATLSGCVTTPSGGKELTPAGKVALQETAAIATRRYLRDRPNQAERVANIRAVAVQLQSVTDAVTLARLKELAIAEINKRVHNEWDKADAISLVNMFEVVLVEQYGDGVLFPDQLVKVNEFLVMLIAALPPVPAPQ